MAPGPLALALPLLRPLRRLRRGVSSNRRCTNTHSKGAFCAGRLSAQHIGPRKPKGGEEENLATNNTTPAAIQNGQRHPTTAKLQACNKGRRAREKQRTPHCPGV